MFKAQIYTYYNEANNYSSQWILACVVHTFDIVKLGVTLLMSQGTERLLRELGYLHN